jgi:chromosome partitioning protein
MGESLSLDAVALRKFLEMKLQDRSWLNIEEPHLTVALREFEEQKNDNRLSQWCERWLSAVHLEEVAVYFGENIVWVNRAVITFLNQKGGVGKTTLSLHAAYWFAKYRKVLLIDADPQGSARDWSSARAIKCPFTVVGYDRPTLHKELDNLADGYSVVFIDAPPRVTGIARSCIMAADAVVIPMQPSGLDMWATEETLQLLKEAVPFKGNLSSSILINREIANTVIGRTAEKVMRETGQQIFDTHVRQRTAYATSISQGQTVFETEPDGAAAHELNALFREMYEWVRTCISGFEAKPTAG